MQFDLTGQAQIWDCWNICDDVFGWIFLLCLLAQTQMKVDGRERNMDTSLVVIIEMMQNTLASQYNDTAKKIGLPQTQFAKSAFNIVIFFRSDMLHSLLILLLRFFEA